MNNARCIKTQRPARFLLAGPLYRLSFERQASDLQVSYLENPSLSKAFGVKPHDRILPTDARTARKSAYCGDTARPGGVCTVNNPLEAALLTTNTALDQAVERMTHDTSRQIDTQLQFLKLWHPVGWWN